jgi:hypothetical protein
MKLTSLAQDKILGSRGTVGKLADVLGKHPDTIRRMVSKNEKLLTHPDALAVIRSETKLSDEQLLTSIEKAA